MKSITARDILDILNKLAKDDHEAVENLVALRVDCTKLQFYNPELVPFDSEYKRPLMGLLEVLNRLLYPSVVIYPVFNSEHALVRFKIKPLKD